MTNIPRPRLLKRRVPCVNGEHFVMPYYRLVDRHPVFLVAFGCGDDARFAAIFRQTWRRIPPGARRTLLAFWARHQLCRLPGPCFGGPKIELLNSWSADGDGSLAGQVGLYGAEIRFSAPMVGRMPDDAVSALIAHELAHVWHFAMESDSHMVRKSDVKTEEEREWNMIRCEADVANVLWDWGFDEDALDDWFERDLPARQPAEGAAS